MTSNKVLQLGAAVLIAASGALVSAQTQLLPSAPTRQFGGTGRDALSRILGHIQVETPVLSRFDCDVTIHRRDANEGLKKLEKDKKISEDDVKRGEQEVQKKTDAAIAEVDKILAEKEKEILTI